MSNNDFDKEFITVYDKLLYQTDHNDIDKAFVSVYDKFLYQFDADHAKTASQIKEIKKHKRIAYLRDNSVPLDKQMDIWEDF